MRSDWYTKGVLTVIAVLLGVIALRPYVSPDAVAYAQGSFSGVEWNGSSSFFDTKTGELWFYDGEKLIGKLRLAKLGAPLVKEK